MRNPHLMRAIKVLSAGAILLQAGACDLTTVNQFVQTILLGITAAGSIAILQNV